MSGEHESQANPQINISEVFFGAPGTGKSTAIEVRALELQTEFGAYAIAHDPTGSMGRNGAVVHRHGSANDLYQSLGSQPDGIHTIDFVDGADVVTATLDVAAAACKLNPPRPTILILDEIVGVRGAQPTYLDPTIARAFLWRRHSQIIPLLGSQRPQLVSPSLYDSATRIVMFRLLHAAALAKLADAGIPRDIVDRLPTLPDHHHLEWSPTSSFAAAPEAKQPPSTQEPPAPKKELEPKAAAG